MHDSTKASQLSDSEHFKPFIYIRIHTLYGGFIPYIIHTTQ
jgi:hypothetical protein